MAKKSKLLSSEKEPEPESDNNEEEEEVEESEESEEEEEEEEEEEVEVEEYEEEAEEEEEEEEEEEDLSSRETLSKLLDPFSKDQLIDLLKDAAARNPSLLSRISDTAESDPAHRKIFVHGLAWDCTTETLTAAFKPYGEIEECKAVADRATGRGKGYGFVLFRDRRGARKALKEPQKVIGGRSTSCQLASKGYSPAGDGTGTGTGRRVYVGNVGADVGPERLRAFFAKFGEIEEGPFGIDKASGKFRGFAIFVYKTPEGCRKALEEPVKVFEGCVLQCQRAIEGPKQKMPAVTPAMPAVTQAMPAVTGWQQNDFASIYAYGPGFLNPEMRLMRQGIVGQSGRAGLLNSATELTGQGQSGGVGLLNPAAGISSPANRSVTPTSHGVGAGVNTVSPSVIGSYQSQAALQGLGGYQSQAALQGLGGYQSQAALQGLGGYQSQAAMNPGMKSQSSLGSSGSGLPSYLGR